MSQEAEYYLRNINYQQATDLARRIAQEERGAAERQAHELMRRETQRLEGRLQGEIHGLRDEFGRRNAALEQQLDCNRRLTEALQERANLQGDQLAQHDRALQVLDQHSRELRRQQEENKQLIGDLDARQARLERRFQEDLDSRKQEQMRQARSVTEHLNLAEQMVADVKRNGKQHLAVGLASDLSALDQELSRAQQAAANAGQEQVAAGLLIGVQNSVFRLMTESNDRRAKVDRLREVARLADGLIRQRLALLGSNRDIVYLFQQKLSELEEKRRHLESEAEKLRACAEEEFSRLLAGWELVRKNTSELREEVESLWREKDQILDRVHRRNHVVQALLRTLMELWGSTFQVDHTYAKPDDPTSVLLLQTKRTHGPNVTVHIDLDGRMQVSFTGYVGMECAADVAEFRQKLEKAGELKVDQESLRDRPDNPNPPGLEGGGGPLHYRGPASSENAKFKKEEAR